MERNQKSSKPAVTIQKRVNGLKLDMHKARSNEQGQARVLIMQE